MTDISIIGTGCLIVALVIAAGVVIWQRLWISDVRAERDLWRALAFELEAADSARKRHCRANLAKGRATQTARALAKKAAGQ